MKRLVTLMALLMGTALAQGALLGDWQGQIGPGSLNLGVVVHFAEGDGGISGTLDIPAQGAQGLALDIREATDAGATFVIAGVPGEATFAGTLQGDTLSGTFTQSGQEFPFELTRRAAGEAPGAPTVPALLGNWQGVIDPEGFNQRVGLVLEDENGAFKGSVVFPDQGVTVPLIIQEASETGLSFVLEGAPGNQSFTGTLSDDVLSGEFSVNGQSFPGRFERSSGSLGVNRPQEPQPPFPYRTEEVTVASGDVSLAGTLTLPEGEGPFPAVLFLSGSGPQDRDEALYGHKPFLVIADALTRAGFATLRLDDRGVGGSTGDFAAAGFDDFAADVTAGLAYLRSRQEIDPERTGLLGHSEGGYVAPLAISQGAGAAFFVDIAGPSVPGIDVLKLQNYLIYKNLGRSDEEIRGQLEYLDALYRAVKENRLDDAKTLTREQLAAQFSQLPEGERPNEEQVQSITEAQLANLESGWFRDFLTFDPQPYLRQITVPVLAIYGKLDVQVPAVQSMGVMKGTLERAGNDDVVVVAFERMNHLMQPSVAGAFPEYGQIETTVMPEVLDLIVDWLSERFR